MRSLVLYLLKSGFCMYLGKLHLHPISESYQFNPSLTYLDMLAQKQKPRQKAGSDSEDDGPPPDPDDPTPAKTPPKRERKASTSSAKEVVVTARRSNDGNEELGGLSSLRREMIMKHRKEREEAWESLEWRDDEVWSRRICLCSAYDSRLALIVIRFQRDF